MRRENNSTNRKRFLPAFVLLFVFLFGVNGFLTPDAEAQIRSGAAFLKILPGARLQSMAGCATGLLDEDYAFYANPGAAGFLREWQWSMTYTKWITDIYNISLNYGKRVSLPWSERGRAVLGINYQGVKAFDSSRGAAPPASANDLLVVANLASPIRMISRYFSVGLNLKYFRSNLAKFTANAFIVDAGALCRTKRFHFLNWGNGLFKYGILSAGVAVTQFGNSLHFMNSATPLPRTYRGGVAFYTCSHNGFQIQISMDYQKIRDENGSVSLGTELSIGKRISMRGGYNFNNNLLSKYSFGIGVRLDDYGALFNNFLPGRKQALKFDMAALQNNDFFSNAYRVSVTNFPNDPEKFDFENAGFETYTTEDSIFLRWETTQDPDLFDDVHYGVFLTQDSLELAGFIQKLQKGKVDLSKKPAGAVVFLLGPSTLIKSDRKQRRFYMDLAPLPGGNYYWTVWAHDDDQHTRFAVKSGQKIRHFRVLAKEVPVPPNTISDLILAKSAEVRPMRLNIHFGFNVDTLNATSKQELNVLGMALNSKALKPLHVELGGHTDRRGSDAYNMALSQRRVNGAKRYLVAVPGVDASRITAVGYGESQPIIKDAKTDSEYAVNRRVEIKFSGNKAVNNTRPSMGLTFHLSRKIVMQGKKFAYKLTLKNRGPKPAHEICLKDALPDGINILKFNIHPDSLSQDTLFWKFDTLNPGDSLQIILTAKAPDFVDFNPTKVLNKSIVSAANDTNFVNNADSAAIYIIGTPDTVVHFDFDRANVKPKAAAVLLKWARFIEASPNIPICIEGYTDSKGSDAYNLRLSKRRAESVKKWLVAWLKENAGSKVSETHIYTKGWGEKRPVASNKTPEGRRKNRRIVIHPTTCK